MSLSRSCQTIRISLKDAKENKLPYNNRASAMDEDLLIVIRPLPSKISNKKKKEKISLEGRLLLRISYNNIDVTTTTIAYATMVEAVADSYFQLAGSFLFSR